MHLLDKRPPLNHHGQRAAPRDEASLREQRAEHRRIIDNRLSVERAKLVAARARVVDFGANTFRLDEEIAALDRQIQDNQDTIIEIDRLLAIHHSGGAAEDDEPPQAA